jgi:hypothetical protein
MCSYFATTADPDRISFETRVVLPPGASTDLRFVAYTFEPNWGWRSALDDYYLAFPECFHPHPKTDPRMNNTLDCMNLGYGGNATLVKSPELFRRLRAQCGWVYAPFKRIGDFYGRPEYWINPDPATESYATNYVSNIRSAEDWRAVRHKNFEEARRVNVSNLFYISNAIEKYLAEGFYPDAVIKPPSPFVWRPWESNYRSFTAGGKYGQQLDRDLADLARENYIGGFAWDSTGGMGQRIYRGSQMWDMPAVAFDEDGPYVFEGVGIATTIHHMHSMPAFDGRYVAGCKINPSGEHPMPYMLNIAADVGLVEWRNITPYVRSEGEDAPRYLPLYRHLMGQKAMVQHSALRGDTWGENIDWHKYPPEQMRLMYRAWIEYNVIADIYYGVLPQSQIVLGVPEMSPIVDMLIDLICERGWYATPAATAPAELLLSRYGQGLRSVITLGNGTTAPISGKTRIYGRDVGGGAPLVASYTGEAVSSHVSPSQAEVETRLKPRRWQALELTASYRGKASFEANVQIVKTRHMVEARVRNDSNDAVAGQWQFPAIPGYGVPEITLGGKPVAPAKSPSSATSATARSGVTVHAAAMPASAKSGTAEPIVPNAGTGNGGPINSGPGTPKGGSAASRPSDGTDGLTIVSASLAKGAVLSARYFSKTYLSSDESIAAFPFVQNGQPQATIILPQNAGGEAQQAANWIREYFRFWYAEEQGTKNVMLPITDAKSASSGLLPNTVVLRTGQPRAIRVQANTLEITAPDEWDLSQWVWESLHVLDSRYPFSAVFHAAENRWYPDPPYDYVAKTKQMLKEIGLWGQPLHLYQGPELSDIPSYSSAQIAEMYNKSPAPEATH